MSTSTPAAAGLPQDAERQSRAKTLWGTGIGNALEWYDWNVYASFAVYFSSQIFNAQDTRSAFLKTMAVFAVGFVARPFGGVLFGWMGDRWGRKPSMAMTVGAASLGSLIVAVCPTYHQAGVWASVVLVLGRLVQGLAHGGELPSAQTYLAEHAPAEKRGLWSSSIYVTGTVGLVAGLLLGLLLQHVLDAHQMKLFGWRIPFALGAVMGLFAFWLRSSMEETELFEEHQGAIASAEREHILATVARNWRTGLQVIGITCGLTVLYYVWNVTMASLAQTTFGYSAGQAFSASLVGDVVFMAALPVAGALSDRFGRKPLILASMLGSAVLTIPLFKLAQGGHFWQLALAICVELVFLAGFLGHAPATYAEMFSTGQRTAGFGIYYAVAIALFGGTASYVLTWLGDPMKFAIYAIVLSVISVLTALRLPETKGIHLGQLTDRHER